MFSWVPSFVCLFPHLPSATNLKTLTSCEYHTVSLRPGKVLITYNAHFHFGSLKPCLSPAIRPSDLPPNLLLSIMRPTRSCFDKLMAQLWESRGPTLFWTSSTWLLYLHPLQVSLRPSVSSRRTGIFHGALISKVKSLSSAFSWVSWIYAWCALLPLCFSSLKHDGVTRAYKTTSPFSGTLSRFRIRGLYSAPPSSLWYFFLWGLVLRTRDFLVGI